MERQVEPGGQGDERDRRIHRHDAGAPSSIASTSRPRRAGCASMSMDFRGPICSRAVQGRPVQPDLPPHAGGRRYVLRRKPPGKLLPSAHAVDREYRVITALGGDRLAGAAQATRSARTTASSARAFYVMDCVEGRIFWDQTLPASSRPSARAIFDAMNDVDRRLHNVDYAAIGLEDYGRPGNYWRARSTAGPSNTGPPRPRRSTAMDRLIDWLPQHLPAERRDLDRPRRLPARQHDLPPDRAARPRGARLGAVDARQSARAISPIT